MGLGEHGVDDAGSLARREMRRERELKLPRRPTAAAQDGALTPPAAAQRQPKLMAAAAQTTAVTFWNQPHCMYYSKYRNGQDAAAVAHSRVATVGADSRGRRRRTSVRGAAPISRRAQVLAAACAARARGRAVRLLASQPIRVGNNVDAPARRLGGWPNTLPACSLDWPRRSVEIDRLHDAREQRVGSLCARAGEPSFADRQ